MWRAHHFQFLLTFFGLSQNYRVKLFDEIHEIVFHGNNYDWGTVYNMPIWLRKLTYKKIEKFYQDKNDAIDKQNNMITAKNVKDIAKPPTTTNTYTTKVPKK